MSPEQAQGQAVDARSDVFSFGAVLYEMLTGRRAFRGDTPFATITAVINEEPPPLEAPAALERIVSRCLRQAAARSLPGHGGRHSRTGTDRGQAGRPCAPSIAVLPFANMSRDADDEYFSDGLAEELINLLAHVPNLKVTARTSVVRFPRQGTGHPPDRGNTRRLECARRQRPPRGKPDPSDRAADQRRRRLSSLVGTVRPRADRRLRDSG